MSKADLLEQLAADARRLRVGQRLPAHGHLSSAQRQAVRENLQTLLDRPGVTLARVAEALGDGFSRNTLARFLKAGDDATCPIDHDRVARAASTRCSRPSPDVARPADLTALSRPSPPGACSPSSRRPSTWARSV